MIRGDCVSNHHQKSLDGNFVSTANVWDKPCDSEGSEGSSNIHIKVKFMSRKESSVDTNYEDYLNQFIEEEYRSEIESIDEIGVDRYYLLTLTLFLHLLLFLDMNRPLSQLCYACKGPVFYSHNFLYSVTLTGELISAAVKFRDWRSIKMQVTVANRTFFASFQ